MGYLDYAGLQYLWGKLKEKFAPKSHSHDDRYYTESEMDGKLSGKADNTRAGANDLINKLDSGTAAPVDDDLIITQWANHTTAAAANKNQYVRRPMSSIWNYIKGKTDGVYQPKGSYAASGHTHDDRYYTESEMNTKLSGKSNIDHTHNIIKDSGDGRNIKIAYSKSGLNYGDYSWLAGWNGEELRAVNKNQFATANHTHPTSEIYGGNVNYSGYAGPIESAHIDVLRANRLAFLPASGIKVEYSVDGGATWIDYGATDDQKASLFAMRMGSAASFYTGKHTKADECTIKDQLRITVTPVDRYASVNMLYLWVSVAGTSATVNISRSTIGAKETFTDVRTDVPISGWSGPNEIRFSGGTFGGGSTQTSNAYAYRFTFKNKADGKGSVSVMDIRMYGPSAWGVPNSMMEKDHIYNWDINQNVQFPAQVTATKFNGSSTGVVDYGDSNGSTIKVGFGGAGLTKDKLTHIAGYAKDGNQTVIKDVSKGVLQSWLDLGASAYKKVQSLSAVGHSDWRNQSTDDGYVPTMAFMAFWNGAFNGNGNSNLQYCDRGRFGTIVTKSSGDYAAAGHTHSFDSITGKPSTYTPSVHTHDDRYYTETEMNAKLDGKSNTGHTHDDRYYTETEINTKLNGKANSSHTHTKSQITDFPASLKNPTALTIQTNGTTAAIYDGSAAKTVNITKSNIGLGNVDNTADANKSVKYATSAGNASKVNNHTVNIDVPADAKFTDTNTWRGIQNNLTSDSTDQSLSAAQGKALKTLVDGKAPISHTHKKSQITDFPSSMPASDVYAWAKAATKPSYTKAEVGLGNVDNTADKNKSVNYATSAGSATNAQCLSNDSQYMRFHWNGQSGQPSWLWGGSDASNMYVYNPSNFSVNYANSAGTTLDAPYTITYEGTYTGTGEDTGSASLPIRHTLSKSYDLVYFIKNLKNVYIPSLIDRFSQGNYGKQYVAMNMLPTTFTAIINLSPNRITMYNGGSNNSTSGQAANMNYIRRNGNSIEFYSTYSSNNADYFFNDKYTSYYIFGFNLNHSLFHYDV